jgi:3-isopropylmalate/(R)-2-methylmalate dehydratase small subunit
MEPFHRLTSKAVVLLRDDVDTDQIIPARFLKGTTKAGLGRLLFHDWRYDPSGAPRPDFALNPQRAQVLVAGRNFGCGSSREHAVWALRDYGFRAVVSTSFADIFKNNALQNGLLPIALSPEAHARLLGYPGEEVTIDLEAETVTLVDGTIARFTIDPFARYCLLRGTDALAFLLAQEVAITRFEARNASQLEGHDNQAHLGS